jgi:tetratricopeptide (TPR) repeat protein
VGAAVWLFWRGWRVSWRVIAAAAAVLIAGAVFYYSTPGWQLRSRTRWFVEDPWGGPRPLLWRDSILMAAHRLSAGFGPETFTAQFPLYESKELARAYPDFAHESPHNIFLDALVAQGVPGLLALAALCAVGFRAAWRARDRHPTVAPAIAGALAAGVVAQQFTAFTIPTAVIFFATIALAAGLDAPPPERPLPIVWAPVALALLYFALRLGLTDRALQLAKDRLTAGDTRGAARHFDSARIPGASSDLWYSRSLTRAGDLPGAIAAGLRATETAEDPFNAWYSLSALYAAQNDAQRAELSLRNAIQAHPTWFKPHWTLARLLALTGRGDEARREARDALDLDAGKHPEVVSSLQPILGPISKPFQK